MESNWLKKEKEFQTVTSTLKRCVHDMQLEITTINNEKYFLQRLCNDLKLALKSHASRNKVRLFYYYLINTFFFNLLIFVRLHTSY